MSAFLPMLALIAASQAAAPSAKPPTAPLVSDFLAVCANDAKACSDILFDHTWRFSTGKQTVGYCLPQQQDHTSITTAVVGWLKGKPDMAASQTDAGLNKALEALYPCG